MYKNVIKMSLDIENDTISYKKEEEQKENKLKIIIDLFLLFLLIITFLLLSPFLAMIDLFNYVKYRKINRIKENEKVRRKKEDKKEEDK